MSVKKPFDFTGVITALVSPFIKGALDLTSFRRVIRHQLDQGVQGFVVNGTTGESPTLKAEEVKELLKAAQSEVGGQVPIIMGTGSNSTSKTLELTRLAADLNADAALVVTPYYNKPPQRGLIEHFSTVAEAVKIPMILYNVPARTGVQIEPETVSELSRHKNIVGIKEATGDLGLMKKMKELCPPEFVFLSGDDETCVEFCLQGGQGVISVLSHVIPKELVQLVEGARSGDKMAVKSFKRYLNLTQALFTEANPIPVKMALFQMGQLQSPELRLPLVTLAADKIESLEVLIKEVSP